MSKEELHRNNPLQGVGLKTVLEEIVTYYGFDILDAYLNMKCFRMNPSISACAKFLKKTDWAREKVEIFYLYQYKNLPTVSSEQFNVAPRERIVPEHHQPGEPAKLSIEDGHRLQQKRNKNAAGRNSSTGERKGSSREYNDRRSTQDKPINNTRNSNLGVNSHYYKTNDSETNQSGNNKSDENPDVNEPAPVFNPWDNLKKRK